MATNLKVKMGEIGRLTLALVFLNGVECHNSISKGSSAMIWLHCVKFGEQSVQLLWSLRRAKMYTPRQSAVWLCGAPLLDLARISTEFSGRSLLSFVSPIRQRASLLCRAGYTLGC